MLVYGIRDVKRDPNGTRNSDGLLMNDDEPTRSDYMPGLPENLGKSGVNLHDVNNPRIDVPLSLYEQFKVGYKALILIDGGNIDKATNYKEPWSDKGSRICFVTAQME